MKLRILSILLSIVALRTPGVFMAASSYSWEKDQAAFGYVAWLAFSWRGRIQRRLFLFGLVGVKATSGVLYKLLPHSAGDFAIALVFVWILGALSAKRLHDIGWTAWWELPATILALCASPLLSSHRDNDLLTYWYAFLTIVLPVALLLTLLLKRGNASGNEFGEVRPTLTEIYERRTT